MRLKDFLNEQAEELGAITGNPPRDGSSPDGAYDNHLDGVQAQLDKITDLLSSHIETQGGSSDKWSHASDLAGVTEKLQEVIDMLSGEDAEDDVGDDSAMTESHKVGDAVVVKSLTGPRKGTIVKIGTRGKFPEITVKHAKFMDRGEHVSVGYPPEKVTKASTVSEGTNHLGERTIASYSKWKAACRAKNPAVRFEGDKDICNALPKVGEWDGETGVVYK